MTSRRNRENLQAQLLDTERMLQLVAGHPFMSISFQRKAEELRQQLEKLPLDQKEPKITLLFHGKPVAGSQGIEANFAGKVVLPFQIMVNSDFAQRRSGKVGDRGQTRHSRDSQLFITALPRGSFGFELTKLQNNELYDEGELSDTLMHLTHLIEASAKSDEDFAMALDDTSPRTIKNLGLFLKVLSKEEAGVTIETGSLKFDLSAEQARIAHDRVSVTKTEEDTVTLSGVLRGAMLDSWRYDFTTLDGEKFSGQISKDLSEEEVKKYLSEYIDKPVKAMFEMAKVVFKNGRERVNYRLLGIEELQQNQLLA